MTHTMKHSRPRRHRTQLCLCMKHCSGRCMRRQAGTAMLETVLVLPLVFMILGLIFFFGSAFEREQQQRILARYDVTRVANQATPLAPASVIGLDDQQPALNELFFDGRGDFVSVTRNAVLGSGAYGMIDDVRFISPTPAPGDVLELIVNRAQRGNRLKLVTDFTRTNRIFDAINGPTTHYSVHMGPSWAYADAMQETADGNLINPPLTASWVYARGKRPLSAETSIRDIFYADFNRQLDNFGEPATRMVRLIRGMLYANQPGYRGPTVHFTR